MTYTVDTTKEYDINLCPDTVYEEVMQNLYFLYSSMEYDVPLNRGFGLSGTFIDKPTETAKALATINIYDKTEEYEPRAEIVSIDFEADYERGILKPIVEVEINDEYDSEEDT